MVVISRILIFLILLFLGLNLSWEFGLAGVIFLLSLYPARYEYILLGIILDVSLSFPLGFFTLIILVLTIVSVGLTKYFKEESGSSLLVRMGILVIVSSFIAGVFFLSDLSSEPLRAASFTGTFILKSLALIIPLIIFYSIFRIVHAKRLFI